MSVGVFVDFADDVLDFIVCKQHLQGFDLVLELCDFELHFLEEILLLFFNLVYGLGDFVCEAVECALADSACLIEVV